MEATAPHYSRAGAFREAAPHLNDGRARDGPIQEATLPRCPTVPVCDSDDRQSTIEGKRKDKVLLRATWTDRASAGPASLEQDLL